MLKITNHKENVEKITNHKENVEKITNHKENVEKITNLKEIVIINSSDNNLDNRWELGVGRTQLLLRLLIAEREDVITKQKGLSEVMEISNPYAGSEEEMRISQNKHVNMNSGDDNTGGGNILTKGENVGAGVMMGSRGNKNLVLG